MPKVKREDNPYIFLLKTAWHYAQKEKKTYAFVYFLFLCASSTFAIYPMLLGWFIDKVQRDNNQVLYYAFLYAGLYLGLKLLDWAFHGPARIMERNLAFQISRNFLQERYHQVLHLPAKWHQDHHSGSTINRIRKAYEALKDFFGKGFQYVYVLGKFFLSVGAIVWLSPIFGSLAVLLGLLNIFIIRTFDKPYVLALEEVNEAEHIVSSTLFDSLSNIITVITLRLEKSMETGLMYKVQQILKPFRRSILINEWKWFCSEMMIAFIYGMITVGYIYQHWHAGGIFYVGGLVTILAYINQFTSVFQDIAWQYNEVVQYSTYVKTASNIDEAYSEYHRPDISGGLPKAWKEIVIKDIRFTYPLKDLESPSRPNLSILEFHIKRGNKIALIGESGSGKSTLFSLLRGLYQPEPKVDLKVDGLPVSLNRLNESVTLFPQDPEIFENTILYNITLGLPFSQKEIEEACRIAHFTEVLESLSLGLETDIREKGVNLSGGQKQRLALARGVLAARDSNLILLDEPTSSVDIQTESKIYEDLFTEFSDKAMISSLHRLYFLSQFDYVYILNKGLVLEEGTFEYLRENSDIFQELWKHQMETENISEKKSPVEL